MFNFFKGGDENADKPDEAEGGGGQAGGSGGDLFGCE